MTNIFDIKKKNAMTKEEFNPIILKELSRLKEVLKNDYNNYENFSDEFQITIFYKSMLRKFIDRFWTDLNYKSYDIHTEMDFKKYPVEDYFNEDLLEWTFEILIFFEIADGQGEGLKYYCDSKNLDWVCLEIID